MMSFVCAHTNVKKTINSKKKRKKKEQANFIYFCENQCLKKKNMCSSQEELFEQNVVEIEARIKRLRSDIEMSRLVINEHCLELARQLDIETETKIEKSDAAEKDRLNERRKKWLKEISEYEAECVRLMEATRGQLLATIETTEKWLESHRDSPVDSVLIQQSDEHLREMTRLAFELKGFQFRGKLLLFIEEYELNPGCLSFKKLRVPKVLENYYSSSVAAESSKPLILN
jgi:hypothetical protein